MLYYQVISPKVDVISEESRTALSWNPLTSVYGGGNKTVALKEGSSSGLETRSSIKLERLF